MAVYRVEEVIMQDRHHGEWARLAMRDFVTEGTPTTLAAGKQRIWACNLTRFRLKEKEGDPDESPGPALLLWESVPLPRLLRGGWLAHVCAKRSAIQRFLTFLIPSCRRNQTTA